MLVERIRTQLQIIRGFAGLARRRDGDSTVCEAALARIDEAVVKLDSLLQEYEAATGLRIQHPELE